MIGISAFTSFAFLALIVLGIVAKKRGWQGQAFWPLIIFLATNLFATFFGDAFLDGVSYREKERTYTLIITVVRMVSVGCLLSAFIMAFTQPRQESSRIVRP
jgi:hypothetical protein